VAISIFVYYLRQSLAIHMSADMFQQAVRNNQIKGTSDGSVRRRACIAFESANQLRRWLIQQVDKRNGERLPGSSLPILGSAAKV
jgi:hypothetical protein